MSYEKGQINRQAILDHLHLYPMKGAKRLSDDLGIGENSVESCIRYMIRIGEIEKIGAGRSTVYKAIAVKTITAEMVKESVAEKRTDSLNKDPNKATNGIVKRPGYYVQRGGGWQSKGGGGQGAVRRETGIQSSASYV